MGIFALVAVFCFVGFQQSALSQGTNLIQKTSQNPLVPVGESLPPTPLNLDPKPLQEIRPHQLILEDSDLALETMRHMYLENLSHQKYKYKTGGVYSNFQASSNRYYTRSGKSTATGSPTNYMQLDDGIPDNDPENDTIVYQHKPESH